MVVGNETPDVVTLNAACALTGTANISNVIISIMITFFVFFILPPFPFNWCVMK